MNSCLNLAANTSHLQQENNIAQTNLQETRNQIATETSKLIEIRGNISRGQDTNVLLSLKGQDLQREIALLNSALDTIKNIPNYRILTRLIREAVDSITTDQTFALQICLIAIIKLYQQDPTLIPFFQFPVPGDCDTSAQTAAYQSVLIKLITETNKIMPNVLDELASWTGKKVLPKIPNLETLIDPGAGFIQDNDETNLVSQTRIISELEVHSNVLVNYEELKGDHRIYVMETYLVNPKDATDRYFLY